MILLQLLLWLVEVSPKRETVPSFGTVWRTYGGASSEGWFMVISKGSHVRRHRFLTKSWSGNGNVKSRTETVMRNLVMAFWVDFRRIFMELVALLEAMAELKTGTDEFYGSGPDPLSLSC